MASYSTNSFKNGLKFLLDGSPCSILNYEFVKPGKGQAFVRVVYKNLLTSRTLEKTFKSGESVEAADVVDRNMQFLYKDAKEWHFMDPESFDQISINQDIVGNMQQWLKEQDLVEMTFWNEQAISFILPNFVELRVTECAPGVRGDSVSSANKEATLETGAIIKVPLFINEGDTLKIDTRSGSYVSRV